MDSAEFAEWCAYYQLEPFGQERDNMHAAIIACAVSNSQGAKTKIKDFMLRIRETVQQQTAKQMESILKMFTGWFNGTKEQ